MRKRYDQNPCPQCGNPKRKVADLCSNCNLDRRKRAAEHPSKPCQDCGAPLGDHGNRAARCWKCWMKVRRSQPVKACSVEGCKRPHKAKGYCIKHYQGRIAGKKARHGATGINSLFHSFAKLQPCQLCGYDKMPSHAHRLLAGSEGGTYVPGNVSALCARCHDEVHRGITAAPAPLKAPFSL